MTVSNLQSL